MGEKMLIAVVGADGRQAAARRALAGAGCRVCGEEGLTGAGCVLLPTPFAAREEGWAALLAGLRPGALVLAGHPPAAARRLAGAAGVRLVDYMAREELAVRNAVPTAEGCIGILLARRSRTLWGTPVLLAGYGRVAQALAPRLTALGAWVTVAARRASQRALAQSLGAAAIPLDELRAAAPGFDTAVNTIPAPVFTGAVLAALRPGSLLVDLASAPGGVDLAEAERLGHTALAAPGLPARCAPDSAGAYLAQTVLDILEEQHDKEVLA